MDLSYINRFLTAKCRVQLYTQVKTPYVLPKRQQLLFLSVPSLIFQPPASIHLMADFTPCPPALSPDPCDRSSDSKLELLVTSHSDSHISNLTASAFQENLFGNCPSLRLFRPFCRCLIFLLHDRRCCLKTNTKLIKAKGLMKWKPDGRTSAHQLVLVSNRALKSVYL